MHGESCAYYFPIERALVIHISALSQALQTE
jgi:hypothetical protein